MKVQIEGSSGDVRGLFNDAAAAKELALAQLQFTSLQKELAVSDSKLTESTQEVDALRKNLSLAAQKWGDASSGLNALRMELGSKNAHIAGQDAEIQRLKFVMSDPVKLSDDQEAHVEELYQKMVEQYNIKPLLVATDAPGNKPISAEYVITTIFDCLANGDKIGACKEIRAASGMPLVRTKKMIEAALFAFGCKVNEKGIPQPTVVIRPRSAEKTE
jgi:ribosomal protein L7/L12